VEESTTLDRIITLVVQITYFVLALMIPGAFVLMGVAWFVKLWRLRPPALPLQREDGSTYTLEDWRREARRAHPYRWWLTETIPAFLARLRDGVRHWWNGPQEEPMSPQEEILHGAFEGLARWVEENPEVFEEDEFEGSLADQRGDRLGEIVSLYQWWVFERNEEIAFLESLPEDEIEFWEARQRETEQLALARLANVWRDLT